jgi:hypothetical protein
LSQLIMPIDEEVANQPQQNQAERNDKTQEDECR